MSDIVLRTIFGTESLSIANSYQPNQTVYSLQSLFDQTKITWNVLKFLILIDSVSESALNKLIKISFPPSDNSNDIYVFRFSKINTFRMYI